MFSTPDEDPTAGFRTTAPDAGTLQEGDAMADTGGPIKAGQRYRHYLGEVYEVVCLAVVDGLPQLGPHVVYRLEGSELARIAPLKEFLGKVATTFPMPEDGTLHKIRLVERFMLLPEEYGE